MTPGLAAAAIAAVDGKTGAFMARAAGVTDQFEAQARSSVCLGWRVGECIHDCVVFVVHHAKKLTRRACWISRDCFD